MKLLSSWEVTEVKLQHEKQYISLTCQTSYSLVCQLFSHSLFAPCSATSVCGTPWKNKSVVFSPSVVILLAWLVQGLQVNLGCATYHESSFIWLKFLSPNLCIPACLQSLSSLEHGPFLNVWKMPTHCGYYC